MRHSGSVVGPQVDVNRVTIGGRQSFGCVSMPDFLSALAKAVKPNGAVQMDPAAVQSWVLKAAHCHQNAALGEANWGGTFLARMQPWVRQRAWPRRDVLRELPAHVHSHGRAPQGATQLAPADRHAVQAHPGAPWPAVRDATRPYCVALVGRPLDH